MLTLILAIKLIAEIALMALFGQWVLGLLAGQRKSTNLFYQVLQVLTRPFVRLTRFITPSFVLERHLPLVAFLLLGFLWIAVTIAKINIDDHPNTPARYGVRGIPTMMLFKDGKVASTKVGAMPKSKIVEWLNESV